MIRIALAALAAGALLVALACDNGGSPEPSPAATATSTPTDTPTATPSPTPVPPPTPDGYSLAGVLPGATYGKMVGFEMLPGSDDEAVIVTQGGVIYRVSISDPGVSEVFGNVSGRLTGNTGTEEGLLGLAFSPDFQDDGFVYLYYTRGSPQPSVLSRFSAAGGTLDEGSEQVLLEIPQPHGNHNGGQLSFGPDGNLYLALGDGGGAGDPDLNGQDLDTFLGKLLRLDVSGAGAYSVPPDNPFVDTANALPEIYAYGLRNPWRFSFDRESGDLWLADVGQSEWEEVNRIVAGGNYGWNTMEGLVCFNPRNGCDQTGLELPRAVYSHDEGCSVTGGYVYRGDAMPELDGWYVYGDYCSGTIWAADTEAADSPPVRLVPEGPPIASFGQLPGGELLVLTFKNQVYRLTRSGG